VRTETRYYCEVCNEHYDCAEAAERCEARPLRTLPPIGCVFGNPKPGEFYADMTFAVAAHSQHGHSQRLSLWACRDQGSGDSLGKEVCGNNNAFCGYLDDGVDSRHPTYTRLLAWLKANGAEYGVEQITVWRNGKAIPLEEFEAQQ